MHQTITRCLNFNQAFRVRLFLESRGIEVFIPDEVTSQLAPMEFFHAPGIRVQVRDEDLAGALKELKDFDTAS